MAKPSMVGTDIMGLRELRRSLKQLGSNKVVVGISRKAVRAACAPFRKAMKAKAPRRDGALKRSIYTKLKTYPSGGVIGITGPRYEWVAGMTSEAVNPGKYAHLVEYGTGPHLIRRAVIDDTFYPVVLHPGARAQPFMRPAWVGKKDAAFMAAQRKFAAEILKAANKAYWANKVRKGSGRMSR